MPILTQPFRTFTNIFETGLEQVTSDMLQMQEKLNGCVKHSKIWRKYQCYSFVFLNKKNIKILHNSIYGSF